MEPVPTINAATWLQNAWRNRLQSLLLLVVMAGFAMLLGYLLWGEDGILILLSMVVFSLLLSPSFSPRLIMYLYDARPLSPPQVPELWQLTQALSKRAGLDKSPELYYLPSTMLNAFAVGSRESPAIGITAGLLHGLNRREIAAVMAHEISHIRSNDLWVMGLADLFSRITSLLSLIGQLLLLVNLPLLLFSGMSISWLAIVLLIFAPHLSALAQLALSRTREFDADLNAARLTGDPEGLASALTKIEQVQGGWIERIFLPGRRIPEPSLLRTHPLTEDRVERLLSLKPDWQKTDFYTEWPTAAGQPEIHHHLQPLPAHVPRWHISGLWY